MYCWRCKIEVTMLSEEEYAIAYKLYSKIFTNLSTNNREERNRELVDYYYKLTGEMDTNPNSIMHHRIALYGPPCENCGKPYRTPNASLCAACGHKRESFLL
jgi:hypothetical protein